MRALAALLALCAISCPEEGRALRVEVVASGFAPRCLKLRAEEPGTAWRVERERAVGDLDGGAFTFLLVVPPGVGGPLALELSGWETGCAGAPVARATQSAALPARGIEPIELRLALTDGDGDGFDTRLGPTGDCDDREPAVNPGAVERCNGRDDDCDSEVDEGFAVGVGCVGACPGTTACAADGGVTCALPSPPVDYFLDEDGDGRGRGGGAVQACAPLAGYSPDAGDCDDLDPFTGEGARELCDRRDNDCDGQVDEAACPPDAGWRATKLSDQDLWAASAWARGALWIVGQNRSLWLVRPDAGYQAAPSTSCPQNPRGAWANAQGGLYVGGGAELGLHRPTLTQCIPLTANTSLSEVVSVAGTNRADVPEAIWALERSGATHRLPLGGADGGGSFLRQGSAPLLGHDVHGLADVGPFVVGEAENDQPGMARFSADGGWVPQALPATGRGGALLGVWMVSPKLGYAVGESGNAFEWNGVQWRALPSPGDRELRSVLAFGRSQVYAIDKEGSVWRFDGTAWSLLHADPNIELMDLTGTAPDDLWVIGKAGWLIRWP